KIYPKSHITILIKYKDSKGYGANFVKPLLKVLNHEKHYEVEIILDSKQWGQGTKYLVK
ncbi:hypothetical protein HETIRDRAFT_48188, partial [Heterobasidion irregulare TC 32-1]